MNTTGSYDLTIIVPIYNERESMEALEKALSGFLPRSIVSTCILMVDDGSSDGSDELIKKICERHAHFFFLKLARNTGLSAALKAGIDACHSRYVGYIDADLQTDPNDFNLLLEKIPDYELVTGIRAKRNDSMSKRLQSRLGNGFRRFITKDTITDTGCPLKVIRTEYAKRIPFFKGMHRFLPALILLQNGRIHELPVHHYPRAHGESKFNLHNRLWSTLGDCFAYRWMKDRYINYDIDAQNLEPEMRN